MKKGAPRVDSLELRLERRIARKRGDVFLRAVFDDMGGYDQVGRALRELVAKGRLIKICQGLYSRATTSPLSSKPIPLKGLGTLTEASERLDLEPLPTRLPTGRVVAVRRRVRRQIGYHGVDLKLERAGATTR